jgi:hypothetical protein
MILLKVLFERLAAAFAGATLSSLRQMLTFWVVIRHGRSEGAKDQRARDAQSARAAEQKMGSIVAERRSAAETRRRLDEGSF